MKIAIIGATGLVGSVLLKVLAERDLSIKELLVVASKKNVGKTLSFKGNLLSIIDIQEALEQLPDIAIFSAGGELSKEWAPKFAEAGIKVIDNSSAWRMDNNVKLIVPEINACDLTSTDNIIANPNCSTIQMVLALAPLHKQYEIKRIVVSTYQSVTGTGVKAVQQMENERLGKKAEMVYPYMIDKNCLPHGGDFDEFGNTSEETKLLNETRKILNDNSIGVAATVVRVPVVGGHSESINVEFKKDFSIKDVCTILENAEGIVLQNDPENNKYPMPKYAEGKDSVFVGRIRRDISQPNTLNLWVVADNLRKGAATNAIQIAEYLITNHIAKQ